ncbi:Phosphoadenosine phosphosulfate reductase family protein [Synechococcus sp. PCC 7335]|uniref:phosphoadenosine phosphosulfate reductase domain-containing protein n=1 Tax=Synechococcus sp. (strain ATCC 29403 / PCC 7335) TaxID=91464 RepID=UPI00017EB563|nr:phosphoadenosine phosphosulfate reductase family protein [Synechococcus sp. PCC 7335]EDX82613.1 Phosphoadenosine phosphosulfate reductase family protein [Synechococcus sp. PCC 7335]
MNTFKQTTLFTESDQSSCQDFVPSLLEKGADLAISISGGKDSDAMLRYLAEQQRASSWPGEMFALFCELGRIEWSGVDRHLKQLCFELAIPLVKLYPNRPMIEEWQQRYETILEKQENKPFWSSSSARFCTKHEKTQPADKLLRDYKFIVCAIGLRAEESSARAKKPRYQVRNEITTKRFKTPASCKTAEQKERWAEQAYQDWENSGRKGRFAISWHPIHHWPLEQVWQQNGTSSADVARRVELYQSGKIEQAIAGFPCHWVYASGNTRLSCSLCVLGSANDIHNGAKHNPQTWVELALMEIVGGWGFQQSRWLASLSDEVLKMSVRQRKQLNQILLDRGLLEPWNPTLMLHLLHYCSPFWTEAALRELEQAISQYWETKQLQESELALDL